MRKRHGAGTEDNRTLCGFECSIQEYASMKSRKIHSINCRHCLIKLGHVKRRRRTFKVEAICG